MNEQTKKILESIQQFWANAATTTKKMMIAGVVVVVIIALVFSVVLNTKEYVVIFGDLSTSETTEILAQLQEMGTDVKLKDDGSVMVLKEDEANVRMTLATEGYPKNGLSYYLIEQGSGMLTTDYERKQYVNMQLQERIAASIKTLDAVRDAIVTITSPNENVFYLQEEEDPSASVIIHMQGTSRLSENQVVGIQNLVVKSVAGLTAENVAISDSSGKDLLVGITGNSVEMSKINITREIEEDIRKKILNVLLGPYDMSEVRISVTATVDTDALIREETLYTPSPDGDNSGVIEEETRSEETSSSTQAGGGIPGTTNNSEIPIYPVEGGTEESSTKSITENIRYQVSQVISQFQKNGAEIDAITVGIAVNQPSFAPGERERIIRLVAHSVGVSEENITVENFVFHSPEGNVILPEEPGGLNKLYLYGGIGAGVLLLLLVLLFVILGRRKKHEQQEAGVSRQSLGDDVLDDLFGEKVKKEIRPINPVQDAKREEIKEFAKSNPEIAAQMIKSWIKSEEEF